jgi:hypothetical protein
MRPASAVPRGRSILKWSPASRSEKQDSAATIARAVPWAPARQPATARGADQGGDRVEAAAQDDRDLVEEDVAEDAAADAADRPQDDRLRCAEAGGQGGEGSGDAEQREAGGVAEVEPAP